MIAFTFRHKSFALFSLGLLAGFAAAFVVIWFRSDVAIIGNAQCIRFAQMQECAAPVTSASLSPSSSQQSEPVLLNEGAEMRSFHAPEFALKFSYLDKQDAVWVDERSSDDETVDTFIYRYPIDPAPGQEHTGNDAYYKTAPSASHLLLVIKRGRQNETAEEYLNRTYPVFAVGTSSVPRPDLASSLLVSYPPTHGSNGGELFIWRSGDLFFELTNESSMFASAEFRKIVDSIVQDGAKD